MLRVRKMERIVGPDYAMDRHKTMTPGNNDVHRPATSWPVPNAGSPLFTRFSRLL
jgi:hypothetical protein